METESELLKTACERINDLAEPAYIKDSTLAYVGVNAAYARMFDLDPGDFIGRASHGFFGDAEDGERREKECRALVFGTEEVVACRDHDGRIADQIHIERFLTEDDRTYIFGRFETRRDPQNGGLPGSVFSDPLLDDTLEMLEMGIGVYDSNDVLLFCNSRLADYLASLSIEVKRGITLTEILELAYERRQHLRMDEAHGDALEKREWIAERLQAFNLPYYERIDQLADGRWLRSVNKRLESGVLIAVRYDVTEFKKQEMLLRNRVSENALFRAVLDNLPQPIFVRDADHRLTYANAAYGEMIGRAPEALMGTVEADIFGSNDRRIRLENSRVLNGQSVEKAENAVFPDGSIVPVLTRKRSIVTPEGERYLVGSRTDVSLIKEAQNKAEKLSNDLQAILDALPVGVVILSRDFIFEYVNTTFYSFWNANGKAGGKANGKAGGQFDLVGRSYREMIEANFDRGLYKDDPDGFEQFYQRRISALLSDSNGPPIEAADHNGRSLVISSTRLSNGKILLTYVDISAVKEREQEVQEARLAMERYGALMHDATSAMSQGLLILHNGAIIFSNDALAGMLDMPPDLIAPGGQWLDLFRFCARRGDLGPSDEAIATFRSWDECVKAGQPVQASFQVDGKKWIRFEATPTGGDQWLAIFTDITDVKEREAELTGLLARAEAADRAKSEFLANMSHEIRTPMNGVLGMAELLAKSSLNTRQKTFIDIIVKSGNSLLTIINDILDFSKIDSGQMKLRKAPFDPVEAIEDVATLLSSSAAEKDIELIVRGDASVRDTVIGDAGRFRQIVTNLVGNAVKFTDRGYVFIDLDSEPIEPGRMMLKVRIEDTGIGISEKKLASVFDKFSQIDTSSTRRHEGTGLGLAITAGLTGLFGGTVEVASEVGRGSVFTVNLPFDIAGQRKRQTVLPINTSRARILVVDDNAVNRRIFTEQLDLWGFDAVAAESGQEALAVMSECRRIGVAIDVIVVDYHMSGMNGADFATAVRRDRYFDATGMIFLTSMDMAGGDSLFETLNIQAHLMKPVRANLLRGTVIDVVRTARTRRRTLDNLHTDASALMAAADPPPVARRVTTPDAVIDASMPAIRTRSSLDVLVAEDNEVNQIVFTQILQRTGWLFQVVNNGAEAVNAWSKYNPAVILMDVSMPVMNGHEATRKIRELEQKSGTHTPIVGVTAHALESDRDLCLNAGMDDYLSKPISPEALEAKIRQWTGGLTQTSASQ